MEKGKAVTGAATTQAASATHKPKQVEAEYTASELANSAKELFGTRKECVAAALSAAGVTKCTVSKAKGLVEAFRKKEVK